MFKSIYIINLKNKKYTTKQKQNFEKRKKRRRKGGEEETRKEKDKGTGLLSWDFKRI